MNSNINISQELYVAADDIYFCEDKLIDLVGI